MSQVFKLRYPTRFAASLALVLTSLGLSLDPPHLAGQVTSGTNSCPIRALQQERLATLRQLADLLEQKRRQGSASLAEVAAAKREAAEAGLELCDTPTERVRVLEQIVADTRLLASRAEQLAQSNLACQEVALTLKAELLRAQIRLERARAELSNEPTGSGQEHAPAGWALRAPKDVPGTGNTRLP